MMEVLVSWYYICMTIKLYVLVLSMFYLSVWEFFRPFYQFRVEKVYHAFVNISSSVISFSIVFLLFSSVNKYILSLNYGLTSFFDNENIKIAVGIAVFDLWMYIWHRANHEIPLFWKFHKAHHSDTAMDVSSGLRFHPIEVILSSALRIPIYLSIGIDIKILAVYETVMTAVVLFHHSNISINSKFDKYLSLIIATPYMHRVHHSSYQKETDSNYGTIFSIWDRLFKSYVYRSDINNIEIGLKKFREDKYQTVKGFLLTPFN